MQSRNLKRRWRYGAEGLFGGYYPDNSEEVRMSEKTDMGDGFEAADDIECLGDCARSQSH